MATDPMALANALDPSLYSQQLQAQQQQALAQLLMQQGLAPMGGTESVGGVAIRRSPMEGLAKMAALLSGQSMQGQANQSLAGLNAQQAASMRAMFGMGDPSSPGAAGMPQGQGPALGAALAGPQGGQPMPAQQPNPMSVNGASAMTNMMSYMTDPTAHMKAVIDQYASTPEMKAAAAAYGAGSPQYVAALQAQVRKAGYVPPNEIKSGNTATDPFTNQPIGYGVKLPEGAIPKFGADGRMASVEMVPGAAGAITEAEAAQGAGKAQNEMVEFTNPDGTKENITKAQAVARATPKFNVKPGTEAAFRETLKNNPEALAAFDRQMAAKGGFQTGQTTSGAAAATKAGALPQEDLDKRYSELKIANTQAETTNSYLQNIKTLAEKAATGQFADKQALLNSLLAQAGISEKATDTVTATNLIDKYSKQIVARLGQGSLGTDAARDLLQAAYPSKYMSKDAIADASDNLIGANQMIQAKMRLLGPHGNARDPIKYQENEQVFDQNADPRIWQYANIQDAAKRKSFLQGILKVDPRFLEKAAKLHEIGAL